MEYEEARESVSRSLAALTELDGRRVRAASILLAKLSVGKEVPDQAKRAAREWWEGVASDVAAETSSPTAAIPWKKILSGISEGLQFIAAVATLWPDGDEQPESDTGGGGGSSGGSGTGGGPEGGGGGEGGDTGDDDTT